MNLKFFNIKSIALLIIPLLFLSSCAKMSTESPEDVIQKFKETAKGINAVDFSGILTMKGVDEGDKMDFSLNADVKVDRRAEGENKADVNLELSGSLEASDQAMSGAMDFKIRTLGEDFYFNLIKFDTTDQKVQKYQTLVEPYLKKWQHLPSDFIPESIKELQEKDEETLEKERQLKELFVSTKLFDVVKEYGIESLNGQKVHHYGVKLNREGLKKYSRTAASINGREMTDAEVEQTVGFADTVTNMEVWIGAKDYYLYKGVVALSDEGMEEKGVKAEVMLTYTANSYNVDPGIEAPADFEEFNPLALMMGLQMNALGGAEGGGEMEGMEMPDLSGLEELEMESMAEPGVVVE